MDRNTNMYQRGVQNNNSFMMPRADLKPEMFDTLVEQKGYRVIWQQGMFCSCYNQTSGQPDYNCDTCFGKGYVYFGDSLTRALVTSINGHKEQEHIGLHDVGSAYLTPLSTDNVGFRDRFTFIDSTTKYSEVITRGAPGYTDGLRYKCLDMIAVRQLDRVFKNGIDFVVEEDQIKWLDDTLMVQNDKYSVLYDINPVYIAINPIHELRGSYTMYKGGGMEQFMKLSKQFQIKREDFLEDGTGVPY